MQVFQSLRVFRRGFYALLLAGMMLATQSLAHAAAVRGQVTDATGAKVSGARVALVTNGKVVTAALTVADGSFQLLTGAEGRFYLVISAPSFRQLETPGFYAGRYDNIERNLVLEPEWVRQSIVVTATGLPTPQAQTGAATAVLGELDLQGRTDLTDALRLMPGAYVTQYGQLGMEANLYVRGGNNTANKVMVDGLDANDMGGGFDFGQHSTTGLERVEVMRGPATSLYGANAASSVVSMVTPRGTTSFPSFLFHGEAGSYNTSREELTLAGAHKKLDYMGTYSWLQSDNDLPHSQYHVGTVAANLGWQLNATTQLRGTFHYGVNNLGTAGAWEFHHVAEDANEKDQNLFVTGLLDNQTTAILHNSIRFGATRKRRQYGLWSVSGTLDPDGDNAGSYTDYCYGATTFGDKVTIKGANGYSATGWAALDCATSYYQYSNGRDQLVYQGDVKITPHLAAMAGFSYEDERAMSRSTYDGSTSSPNSRSRNNYNYRAAFQGDYKGRVFYSLGGSIEHYSLFGTLGTPHAGLSVYALKPRKGVFSGTRVLFNYGDAVREPSMTDQMASLHDFLNSAGDSTLASQLHIGPIQAPTTRTYEGGVEQSFLTQHIIFRTTYFHNQFGRETEYVGGREILNVLNLTDTEKAALEQALGYYYTYDYSLEMNSQAFKAQGIESTLEGGLGRSLFLRGGYTYLDSKVQRSYTQDNEWYAAGTVVTVDGIPVGAYAPLVGARPFRRPAHTGFINASYSSGKLTGLFTAAFASRSDDSTFLLNADQDGGNTLLLPNRNLNHGFAKLDLGGSYQLRNWVSVYAQAENLLDQSHIAPIGYVSLPANARAGLKFSWGPGSSK